jgi:hypothetical protein
MWPLYDQQEPHLHRRCFYTKFPRRSSNRFDCADYLESLGKCTRQHNQQHRRLTELHSVNKPYPYDAGLKSDSEKLLPEEHQNIDGTQIQICFHILNLVDLSSVGPLTVQ